ncbi:MAG: excinuclease ABC subunit UvrC [Clostridia bacterium]|nr:excinuclease ABC subunit UvrC [Clostridia bacterium]
MDIIQEKLKLLPDNPGVYIMLDKFGNVIYVGKARVLKNRVRQYFHNSPKPEKVMKMVENIADFNYIITESEISALALENNLIKKYKPKYNILLKDDKTYPYIKVALKEDFPNFTVTRKLKKDGSKYYGPFMGGINVKDILDTVQLTFSVRLCSTPTAAGNRRECLNYHIGRCGAPCAGKISKEDYAVRVQKAMQFLDGDYKEAEQLLTQKMMAAAENENFELALDYKNKLGMLSKLEDRRITSLNRYIDADIIGYATNGLYSVAGILITRKGIMQGGWNYALEGANMDDSEALTSFIIQYYSGHEIPSELIVPEFCEKDLLTKYFRETHGKSVDITLAKQGDKARLLKMATDNAKEYLDKAVDKIKHKDDMTINACCKLQELLGLKKYPRRMECFDISNVSGVDKVASMVVFVDGEAERSSYRRFKIKTVEGANDFASMHEVLVRRLSKLGTEEEARFPKPDLIIIDGGKGQLSAVREVFDEMGIDDIELISLAKKEEEIFTENGKDSIKIPHNEYALQMLQRIRDEAHRFAITYFRSLHSKRNLQSVLMEIDGIGPVKRNALLEKFGSLDSIMNASVEDIAKVEGISVSLAGKIKDYLENSL